MTEQREESPPSFSALCDQYGVDVALMIFASECWVASKFSWQSALERWTRKTPTRPLPR
jgi:hypothetical protein